METKVVYEFCTFIDYLTLKILGTKENQELFKRNEGADILNIDMVDIELAFSFFYAYHQLIIKIV